MDDNEFWMKAWKAGLIALCIIVATFAGCTASQDYQTRTMIESGKVDALAAACAISHSESICNRLTMRELAKKEK